MQFEQLMMFNSKQLVRCALKKAEVEATKLGEVIRPSPLAQRYMSHTINTSK